MSDRNEDLCGAFILHARKYRDTSLIADLLTETEGRLNVVIRGARVKRPRFRGRLQPFVPLLVSWFGRGELKTVKVIDFPADNIDLEGNNLMIGLYVNELLYRLLGKFDPVPAIYTSYYRLLKVLEYSDSPAAELRRFELGLLTELGYGITFDIEAATGAPIERKQFYRYVTEEGFYPLPVDTYRERPSGAFEGSHLLSISRGELEEPAVEQAARQIVRSSLKTLLGDRPLKSREMFIKSTPRAW
ncbi:MAG: DNA repair protein RecO [Pseudomonadales bacterium]